MILAVMSNLILTSRGEVSSSVWGWGTQPLREIVMHLLTYLKERNRTSRKIHHEPSAHNPLSLL